MGSLGGIVGESSEDSKAIGSFNVGESRGLEGRNDGASSIPNSEVVGYIKSGVRDTSHDRVVQNLPAPSSLLVSTIEGGKRDDIFEIRGFNNEGVDDSSSGDSSVD